jgi:Protein of unknown function (DUF2924)
MVATSDRERGWCGIGAAGTHSVQVTEDGFEYDGKLYSSLSKIAHAITGAHWSGPRFFGLNRKPTAGLHDSGDASAEREDAND